MLVTSPPGWLLPFPAPWPGLDLFLADLPSPCAAPGSQQSRAPSAPGSAEAGLARGAGEGVSLLPTGRCSPLFCRLSSGVLIIPAPGGIVPHYYTVDLYLIRHHLKPSAPSWHPPCTPSPPGSAGFYCSCTDRAALAGQNQRKAPSFPSSKARRIRSPPGRLNRGRAGARSSEGPLSLLSLVLLPPRLRQEMSLGSACLSCRSPRREPHKGALPAAVRAGSISSA